MITFTYYGNLEPKLYNVTKILTSLNQLFEKTSFKPAFSQKAPIAWLGRRVFT